MEKKSKVKTRLKVSEQNQLCHQLEIIGIPLSQFSSLGQVYQFQIKRSGQKGSIALQLIIPKAQLDKKNNLKLGCITIKKREELVDIFVLRVISHKAIKLKDNYYIIQYIQGTELNITYTIPMDIYNQKYKQYVEQMIRKRKQNGLNPTSNRTSPTAKPTKLSKSQPIKSSPLKNNIDIQSKDKYAVRLAKDSSFKRCEHCDYYSSRQKQCGLFTRLVQPYNVCTRFHYTKYRTFLGGGFSPR